MMNTSDKSAMRPARNRHWRRLEMISFEQPAVQSPSPPPAAAGAAPDPAALQREVRSLRQAAETRGHAEGYAAGHAQGLQKGMENGHRQGHDEGYEAGFEAGHAAGAQQARQAVAQLQSLTSACAKAISTIEQDTGQALVALSIRIAEQVLRSALNSHPEKILDLIQDITHKDLDKDGVLKLRLHPDDLELVRRHLASETDSRQWRLQADPSIARGGCVAQTGLGDIDATLETRWERITTALGQKSSWIRSA